MAKGVYVLHTQNPPLVHRDIKSLNLLLDGNFNVKVRFRLCKFLLSRCATLGLAGTEQ